MAQILFIIVLCVQIVTLFVQKNGRKKTKNNTTNIKEYINKNDILNGKTTQNIKRKETLMRENIIKKNDNKKMETLIKAVIAGIGDDPERKGLQDTPKRVAKMYKELFRGYDENQKPKITIFDNNDDGMNYDQMIVDTGYYFSQCEHHMVPFFGEYTFAYIPNKKILGLSKVARIVDYHSAKLQVQERLVQEIVDELEEALDPKGIALVMKGRHLCKEMRGVKKINGFMITSDIRGAIREKNEARNEFMRFVK